MVFNASQTTYDFSMCETEFGGQLLSLTGDGMIWIESARALIASDIHFEKGSFYTRFATLLPSYDSDDALERLESSVQKHQPEIFIALGDSFHDPKAGERMDVALMRRLNTLILSVKDWRWVMGNHDPDIDINIAGTRVDETQVGDIVFRHELKAKETQPEISGHYHPKHSIFIKNIHVSAPCFVQSGNRLIMPAFGSFTGGLKIDHPVLTKYMPVDDRTVFMVQKNSVYKV